MLHNDRKSRHRRIKKQRRYGRLAATSQFLDTRGFDASISSCTNPIVTRDTVISLLTITISSGSSMYLRPRRTHTLPCVEPLSARMSFTRVGCWLSNPSKLSPVLLQVLHDKVLLHRLAFEGSKDFPASRCVASEFPLSRHHYRPETTIPNTDDRYCLTRRWRGSSPGTDWLVG